MDTFKIGTYSDVPENPEKGYSENEPLHPELGHACSLQPPRTCSRRSLVKHPWVIFGTVALTWLVLSSGRRFFFRRPHDAWHSADVSLGFSALGDEDVDQCTSNANWTYYDQPPWTPEHPYGAETTFSLPLDSDALYLVSRGAFQRGQVSIEQSTEAAETVDVRVRVGYNHDKALELATVCQLERADKEYGVGIFTPLRKGPHQASRHYKPKDGLEFDITLTLPTGNEGPLSVRQLETKMPDYSQSVADLQESVLFDIISLSSANGMLSIQSVTSEVGQFSSLNGEIDGHFNARSSLNLHTLNGRIAPTVNLLQDEGADASSLSIHTINGVIDAEVSLTSEASTGGEFEVDAETTNGEIGLKFVGTPVDSVLRCHAETTVGGISVELDRAFEGTYSLQTMLGSKLVAERDVEDPAGRGRHRVVSHNEPFGRLEGEVKWVEGDGSGSGSEGYVIMKAVVPSVRLVV